MSGEWNRSGSGFREPKFTKAVFDGLLLLALAPQANQAEINEILSGITPNELKSLKTREPVAYGDFMTTARQLKWALPALPQTKRAKTSGQKGS